MVNVELFGDLEAVARDAAGALDRAAQPCLHARLDWFRLLAAHCPPEGKLGVIRAEDGPDRAWLFLANGGATASAFAQWYSLRFGLIGADRLADQVVEALTRKRLATVDLRPLAEAEPLDQAFRNAGWVTAVMPAAGNWIARTAGKSFEDYWARRPGALRATAKRKIKAAGLETSVYNIFDPSAWLEYEEVYRQSWKPEEGSFPFLRALAEQEGAAGTLRLGIAHKAGVPVAAQLWLVENGIATIHKLAYAEHAKRFSPGTVLSVEMFRRAIDEDRVAIIDYGTGDDSYKRDWMDERRQLWRLIARNPRTWRGLAAVAGTRASALVRRLRSR